MKKLTMQDVTFHLLPEEEEIHYSDQFADAMDVALIKSELNRGNEWAWFCAHVVAEWIDPATGVSHTGHSYLGCCSHKDEKDFKSDDGYYPGMQQEALDDLNRQLEPRPRFEVRSKDDGLEGVFPTREKAEKYAAQLKRELGVDAEVVAL